MRPAALALLVPLAVAAAAYAVVPDVLGRRAPWSLRRAAPGRGVAALTFDDGPDPDLTPRVLDLLAAAGATATFFMVGSRVRSYPELARRAAAEGHAVGVHTDTHRHAWLLGPAAVRAEIGRCFAALTGAIGRRPLWFRPPWGSFNAATFGAVRSFGLRTVLWSCDAGDWMPATSAAAIAERALRGLQDGAIIDLHDGGRTPAGCAAMVRALPQVLAGAGTRGLRLGHVGMLVDQPPMG